MINRDTAFMYNPTEEEYKTIFTKDYVVAKYFNVRHCVSVKEIEGLQQCEGRINRGIEMKDFDIF